MKDMRRQILDFVSEKRTLVSFIIVTSFFASYGCLFAPGIFYFDSQNYWTLRESFTNALGNFSILNYIDTLRGYLFPLILLGVDKVFFGHLIDDYIKVVVFNSLIMAAISVLLIPGIITSVTSLKFDWRQQLFVSVLLFVFWRGYIFYPLSDFPAFFLLLVALFFFIQPNGRNTIISSLYWRAFLVAFFAGAAYGVRPVYLVSVIVLAVGTIYRSLLFYVATKNLYKLSGVVLCFSLGLSVVFLPQYLINRSNLNINSALVSGGLYSLQLTWGLQLQKYETNTNYEIYQIPQVNFLDPQSANVLQRQYNSEAVEVINMKSLLVLFIRYPLDMLTIYFRHLFNGLNITYHTPYLRDLYRLDLFAMILNYSILFYNLFLLRLRNIRTRFADMLFTVTALILPVLVALPGAVEVRFFLPLHMFSYSMFSMSLENLSEVWQHMTRDRYTLTRTAIFYIIFVIGLLSFSAMIATTIPNSVMLLSR